MTFFEGIFQGIIQGFTEFLPVSSSGHLSLVQYFTGNSGEVGGFFSILLHGGTLVAVVIAFWSTILELVIEGLSMLKDIFTLKFSLKSITPKQRMILLLLTATLPLVAVLFLQDFYSSLTTDNNIIVEGFCFLITSTLLFIADNCKRGKKKEAEMTYKDALTIGVVQAIAPLPGVSRSGSTVSVGIMKGIDKKFAMEFSFIMGIPAVLGAVIVEAMTIAETGFTLDIATEVMVGGFISSVICGIIAIKMVAWLVKNDRFEIFAIYTGILGLLTIGVGIADNLTGYAVKDWIVSIIH